ncbi:hypothetical protein F0562_025474 [Nyssa sinensis]|uniref:Uncharacterized protein n=1 Tax=Nyssa sinensis TaxID=561372 RepID=A0A5J5BA07_9ASTE|nr:hypothetical protein F0562_025474 [Nyssa sinensis]
MAAMMSEMRRVMKLELEQVHEWIDQMETAHEKLQNDPNVRRRGRVQPREVRVEDEEPYGAGFDKEDDRDSVDVEEFDNQYHRYKALGEGSSPEQFPWPSPEQILWPLIKPRKKEGHLETSE